MNDNSSPELIPLKKIQANPYQPRTAEDTAAITEIAINIYRNGLLQIPSARAVNSHYELVFGHTRKAAYELLATKGVPAAGIPADKRFAEMPIYIHALDNKQMFEMAVAENLKRRDLNAIELASALQRYMNEFNVSSKAAGELFNMNEATVRGKVRLLDLPDEAQAKLADGTISEGTARTLLSMQRVASNVDVSNVIKSLEKRNGIELPEQTVEEYLDKVKTTVKMWDEGRQDGKPRGNYNDSWPLDMKNFPVKLLPQLTPVDLAIGLGVQDDKKILALIDRVYKEGEAFIWTLKNLLTNTHRPDLVDKVEHLVNPPACTACPLYTRVNGSHYCGLKLCHDRKTTAWHSELILAASRNLKIEVYAPSDGKLVVLESSYHRDMFNKRDKALRLISIAQVGRNHYQYFNGVEDDIFVVCAVGDGIARLKKQPGGSGSYPRSVNTNRIEYAEIKARQLYKEKRQALIWEFTAIAKHVFDSCTWPMLRIIDDWHRDEIDDRPPEDVVVGDNHKDANLKSEYKRRLLIWKIVEHRGAFGEVNSLNKLVSVANRLAKHAESWGLKFPKDLMKKAIDGDAEVTALLKALQAKKAARVAAETAKAKAAKKK